VTARLPPVARRVLDRGVLCHVAAPTIDGPHLTPVVFVLDGGRLWLTTSRGSVKARAWRIDPRVAGLVRDADAAVVFRGRVRTYDALDPDSWPAAVARGPRIARAATRFAMKNARFFAGYAVDARRVPFAWTPPGRVFTCLTLEAGRTLSLADASTVERWGEWPSSSSVRHMFTPLGRRTGIDALAPATVRAAVEDERDAAVAADAGEGLSVVPARWARRGSEGAVDAALPCAFYGLLGLDGSGTVTITIDRSSTWRAADMTGLMLRGEGDGFAPSQNRRGRLALEARVRRAAQSSPWLQGTDLALVRVRPDTMVWWQGWTSGTVRHSGRRGGGR
jgi:hypothetical protein